MTWGVRSGAAAAALDRGGGGAMGVGRGERGPGRRPVGATGRVGVRTVVGVCVLVLAALALAP